MHEDGSPEEPKAGVAQRVFDDFLRRRETGEELDFEAFVALHPQLERGLRFLWAEHFDADDGESATADPATASERNFSAKLRGLAGPPAASTIDVGDSAVNVDAELPEALRDLLSGRAAGQGDSTESKPRYSYKGEVGRGGMGAVLKVWDEDFDRPCAMKVILGLGDDLSSGDSPDVTPAQLARFLEEAQVTGQLEHPGVVPVHELGVDAEGRVFFTMQLINGQELGEVFELARQEKDPWNLSRAVGVVVKACQAVAFAHARGVVHRDLKPSNIMTGRFGEVYVMDWGLAKVSGKKDVHELRLKIDPAQSFRTVKSLRRETAEATPDSPIVTLDGTVMGTPAHMAPEQARGELEEVDERSDVYALGTILYVLLSGRLPFVEPGVRISPRTVLARLLDGPPKPLRELNTRAPAELVAICEKAMAREKSERYASSLELAEDLQAWIDGRVVRAHRTGAVAELRSWVRRNRSTAAALAAFVVSLAVGLVASVWFAEVAVRNEKVATEQLEEILRLSDIKVLDQLQTEARDLWPAVPQKVVAMTTWIAEAKDLLSRLDRHKETLEGLRRAVRIPDAEELARSGRQKRKFDLQWQHDTLAELVKNLESFDNPDPRQEDTLASMLARREWAEVVGERTIEAHRDSWRQAVRSIADPNECPQ